MKTYFLKIVFAFLFVLSPFVAFAGSEHNITGYAWSSNIGWISFNSTEAGSSSIVPGGPCTLDGITVPDGSSEVFYQEKLTEEDHDCVSNSRLCTNGVLGGNSSFQFSSCTAFDQPCVGAGCIPPNPTNPTIASNPNPSTSNQGVNYGVNKNSDGTLTGYAWSSNIGWIKFGGLSGFPTGDGTQAQNANINGNNLKGWAKALSADDNGWDGWISLSGSGYGISFSSATGYFSGYAWGGDVVGWISNFHDMRFKRVQSTVCCLSDVSDPFPIGRHPRCTVDAIPCELSAFARCEIQDKNLPFSSQFRILFYRTLIG